MIPQIVVDYNPEYQQKYVTSKFQEGSTNGEMVITVNGTRSLTQREFVIGFLTERGKYGAFVNEMYKAWNQMRETLKKPRSTYASFRKLIWYMKKEKIIIHIPESEIKSRKLCGDAPIARSFYRLNPNYLKNEM